jgi:hypothetical protein
LGNQAQFCVVADYLVTLEIRLTRERLDAIGDLLEMRTQVIEEVGGADGAT